MEKFGSNRTSWCIWRLSTYIRLPLSLSNVNMQYSFHDDHSIDSFLVTFSILFRVGIGKVADLKLKETTKANKFINEIKYK